MLKKVCNSDEKLTNVPAGSFFSDLNRTEVLVRDPNPDYLFQLIRPEDRVFKTYC